MWNLLHEKGGFGWQTQFITKQLAVRRAFKDSIFRMLFSDKEKLLTLYNAVNGTNYQDPGLLEVNTLKNAIYMAVHNDISFLPGTACPCMSISPPAAAI